MTNDQHEIRRKFRVLQHAKETGDVSRTCQYFGIGRSGAANAGLLRVQVYV